MDDSVDYRSFFESSVELLATATLDGYFTTLNNSFERILGYELDELDDLTAQPFVEFVHPEDRAATSLELAKLTTGTRLIGFENRFRCKDGSYRWLRWSATRSPEEGLIDAVALDVTEVRAKDEALNKLVADLERSNEELSQLAYVASHDLSEPLRVVAGHVELLARRYRGRLDEDGDRYIEFAVEGCSRMRALIDDLLAFSRAGHEMGMEETVDLREVTTAVLASLAAMIDDSAAIVTIGDLPTVVGARSQFAQVLANLVTNSLRFRRPGATPHVHIDGYREVAGWRIEIEDDGIGVQPEYREQIFRIFQRLHRGSAYPGTGIGLAMCRKMVELRDGKIWCAPPRSDGAKFCFTVPDRAA